MRSLFVNLLLLLIFFGCSDNANLNRDIDNIEIKSNPETGKVFILFGNSKFSLSSLPASDFPEIESENLDINIKKKS